MESDNHQDCPTGGFQNPKHITGIFAKLSKPELPDTIWVVKDVEEEETLGWALTEVEAKAKAWDLQCARGHGEFVVEEVKRF